MVSTTADSSSNHHSPTATTTAATTAASTDAVTDNPNFPRKNLPSPWAQVVRGPDTEPPSAAVHQSPPSSSSSSSSLANSAADQPPPSSDPLPSVENSNSDAAAAATVDSSDADKANNNAGRPKKPAWKRPSNGVSDAGAGMDAAGWPPLSESNKPSAKSLTPESSSKTASDGSLSTPQGPVTPQSPQKQAAGNVKPNHTPNYGVAGRQRLIKRGGGNGNSIGPGHAQSNFSAPPPPPPPYPVLQIPPNTFANGVPGVPDPSPRDPYRNNNWGPRPPVGGFMPPMVEHRSPSRRGNFGHHPRGDGSFHNNNYGNRRDQDRGNYAHARDAHLHQPRMFPRGMMRPPPPNAPSFMGPQPVRPFANPPGFPEFCYFPTLQFEPFGGMPFFTHGPPPAMFFPVAETPLTNMIVNQIDYYFSDANLVKDEFLRSNMNEQGFVPIALIASFPRVKSLTSNIELILDSLRSSTVVELQGDKLRRRHEWMKWLPSAPRRADSASTSPGGSSYNNPAADFEKITLDEATTDKVNSDPSTNVDGDATGESSSQFQLPNGDAAGSGN